MTAKEMILCAARKIEKNPELHCRGNYSNDTGAHCAVGWMAACLPDNCIEVYNCTRWPPVSKFPGRINAAEQMLRDEIGVDPDDVTNYNDDEEHTAMDVVDYLRSLVE